MGKNNNIQLNLGKRQTIENCLKEKKNLKEISLLVGVHPSNVSREIKRNRKIIYKGIDGFLCGSCINSLNCNLRRKCGDLNCNQKCFGCKSLKVCSEYRKIDCKIEKHFPFICNDCKYYHFCSKDHYYYDAKTANEKCISIRSKSRQGIKLSKDDFNKLDSIVKESVINRGLSPYVIKKSNNFRICTKTFYNYINKGLLSVKPIDLQKSVVRNNRKKKSLFSKEYEYQENKGINREGHLQIDFVIFMNKNKLWFYWEMDFLGAPHASPQNILVLSMKRIEFQYLIPLTYPDMAAVKWVFDVLEKRLGTENFKKVFQVILTDRDTKFSNFNSLEINEKRELRTRIFFCNPGASNEKPNVENANSQIRQVFPKEAILENITWDECKTITSHLNSRPLESLNGKRPVDLFIEIFGEEILSKLGLEIISPKELKIVNYLNY